MVEEVLAANACKAVVATSALGMGYDKPDLAFVVHYQAPDSPVAYYQQVGRAGGALSRAEVILLGGPEDRRIWEYFTTTAFPPRRLVTEVLGLLDDAHPRQAPPRRRRRWAGAVAGPLGVGAAAILGRLRPLPHPADVGP